MNQPTKDKRKIIITRLLWFDSYYKFKIIIKVKALYLYIKA